MAWKPRLWNKTKLRHQHGEGDGKKTGHADRNLRDFVCCVLNKTMYKPFKLVGPVYIFFFGWGPEATAAPTCASSVGPDRVFDHAITSEHVLRSSADQIPSDSVVAIFPSASDACPARRFQSVLHSCRHTLTLTPPTKTSCPPTLCSDNNQQVFHNDDS